MASSLPRSTPADQRVDPAAILSFLDALDRQPHLEMHSLMLVRNGRVVAEGWWAPYSAGRPQLLYSLSKSFTSTAAAFAQAEGLLDLDDTVISHFAEFDADITAPRSRAMRLRHVAAMASGHTQDMLLEALSRDRDEPVRGFLLSPPDHEPGTVFAYSQPCTYTLASVIQRNAGMPLTGYLRPRLFDPLGIGPVGWHTFPPGREQGFSGLHARTEDVAKLGLLYLQRGRWQGTQLIPETWVAEATSKQVSNPGGVNSDWAQGYGFQFWMSRHGYRGDGAFGQFCVILPEQQTVIVTTAYTFDMQAMLDAMWTHLLPGLGTSGPALGTSGPAPGATGPAPGATGSPPGATGPAHGATGSASGPAQDELTARLGGLALPACQARAAPADWAQWASAPFAVTDRGPDGWIQTTLTAVSVAPGDAGWQLSLAEAGNALTVPVGSGAWTVSQPTDRRGDTIPVAASGGWLDDGTLRAEIIFLETPHRMDISCALPSRTAAAVWRHPPLMPSKLQHLHSPR